jgi:hypothetical protein
VTTANKYWLARWIDESAIQEAGHGALRTWHVLLSALLRDVLAEYGIPLIWSGGLRLAQCYCLKPVAQRVQLDFQPVADLLWFFQQDLYCQQALAGVVLGHALSSLR